MTLSPRAGWTAVLILSTVGLGGCGIAQAQRVATTGATPPQATTLAPATLAPAPAPAAMEQKRSEQALASRLAQAPVGRPAQTIALNEVTSVKVFSLDGQCDRFASKTVELNRSTALEEAVGQAIASSNNPDFAIAGYRLSDGPVPGQVIVDFRIAPDSERMLESLSICEGLALFGSVRRTLVDNGQFQINEVRFTAGGDPIFL